MIRNRAIYAIGRAKICIVWPALEEFQSLLTDVQKNLTLQPATDLVTQDLTDIFICGLKKLRTLCTVRWIPAPLPNNASHNNVIVQRETYNIDIVVHSVKI